MAGKILTETKELKNGSVQFSNTVKVYSTKSILSYQNGSALDAGAGGCDVINSSVDKMPEKKISDSPCCDHENLNTECLDLLRKKLISDLSLQVFCTDLENKIIKMEPVEISKERLSTIQKLVVQISQLSEAEKLLLYLKLQSSTGSRADPLRQPLNPLGNRQEIQQTIVWIKTHLEEDRDISIPKQDVYDQYLKYCENVSMKPLSTADFGKVMKQVYPRVRPRRLGTRGNSRYCYSGMRNTLKLPVPTLPLLITQGSHNSGSVVNGSDPIAQENEKGKKNEKSKRKWKTSAGRNSRISAVPRLTKPIMKDISLKCPKRSKVENLVKVENVVSPLTGSNMNQGQLKTESMMEEREMKKEEGEEEEDDDDDDSANSFNALDNILANDLGLCFENDDGSFEGSEIKDKTNLSFLSKTILENGAVNQRQQPDMISCTDINESKKVDRDDSTEGFELESNSRIFDKSVKSSDNTVKDAMEITVMGERNEFRSHKVKIRKPISFFKSQRSFTKTYVPIQPKPVSNVKPKVHFDFDRSAIIGLRRQVGKKDSDSLNCEESDSQEPEEEIVRYFRHLEENQFLNVLGKASNSVQIKCNAQSVLKQDEGRSQSCLEDQSKQLEPGSKYRLLQRSQSSVEFSGESPKKAEYESNCGTCDGDKISHLRLLLEKSTAADKCVSEPMPSLSSEKDFKPGLANPSSSNTPVDRKFHKLDGQKVPPSPNVSTRYFNFTPISSASHSPLKTPTSPFVSPRDTPVPRSRQNSFHSDHFFPPSKSAEIGRGLVPECGDFGSEKGSILNKTVASHEVDQHMKETECDNNFAEFQKSLLPIRPRSNSSTNFYRPKGKRSLSKVLSCDRVSFKEPNPTCNMFSPQSFVGNAGCPFPLGNQNLVMSDSSSSEIRQLLENNSKVQENQCATSRSQSVPLNRMIREGSWFSEHTSPVYNHCVNADNDDGTHRNAGEFAAFEPKSLDSFIPNEQMSLDGMNEVFTRENHDIGYQMFHGNFDSSNSDNNNDNEFGQNNNYVSGTCFPSKIEMTVNPFSETFPNETGVLKPYMSNFDESMEKGPPSEVKTNVKLFSNSLYDVSGDNAKDPVITSFKPVFMGEFSSCPNSPVLGFFGNDGIRKGNDDNQLIDFLGLDG